MTSTYDSIATSTLSSNSTLVTFNSIPSTYTDLVLVSNVKAAAGSGNWFGIRFNNDSASNYSYIYMLGSGPGISTAKSATDSQARIGNLNTTYFSAIITNIQNYSNSTTFKTSVSRFNDTQNYIGSYLSSWRSTSAINRIDIIFDNGANMVAGSTFNLYGIKAE